jgi:hypothetical protein
MTTTTAHRIPTREVAGPWSNTYRVSRETLAANLGVATLAALPSSTTLAYLTPTDVYDVTADGLVWLEDQARSSVFGFWFAQLAQLAPEQLASVRNLATSYLIETRTGGTDVADRNDGAL